MCLWVFGGEQQPVFRHESGWTGFKEAVVVRITDGVPRRVFEYRPAHESLPPHGVSNLFTAASIAGGMVCVCTPTTIMILGFPDFSVRRIISHPWCNDLHHVAVSPRDTLYVAVTGLDAVAELTQDGALIRLINVYDGQCVWDRFSRDVDYRMVPSTKPHASHPNFVFFVDGEPYVSRFEQRDAVAVHNGQTKLAAFHEGVHDGHVVGEEVFFTTVDGHVVVVNHRTGDQRVYDLNQSGDARGEPLGWCRGLLPQGRRAWVGFSRLRFTRLRKNLSWVKNGFRRPHHDPHPTRIAQYDLESGALLQEVNLESVGMNAVFSIHEA